jgi:lipid A ethanolaminephosphotransferase
MQRTPNTGVIFPARHRPSLAGSPEVLIFLVSLWIALTCNAGYWRVISENYPPGTLPTLIFGASFLALTVGLISLVMLILTVAGATRLVLSVSLLVAAAAGYFTAHFGVLFDTGMLVNILETDRAEALELISLPIVVFIVLFGLIPALLVWRLPLLKRGISATVRHKGIATLLALSLIGGPLYADQKEIFSVARNNSELRHMIAPLNVISATYRQVRDSLHSATPFRQIALDANHESQSSRTQLPLVHVLLIGETARAANFSLNGYGLETNPELQQQSGISFLEATSCGTATAVSLPCIFSIQERNDFDRDESRNEDNLLDIAARAGYDVYWVDNGNGCKGICSRIGYRDVHASKSGTICPNDICYDEILVDELEKIVSSATRDTLVVLHQLGSHGPAYFRRYPEKFRVFQPDCRSPNFGDCSNEEISNAYDNTIAYTDHVIAGAIDVLSKYSDQVDPSLVYVSDHGESLGEHNVFLHGMPYQFAPDQQTHVPLISWFAADCDARLNAATVSHDNLFHTELGLLGIETSVYRAEMDLFSACRTNDDTYDLALSSLTVSTSVSAGLPANSVH